jgi:hypothetical protein
MLFITGEGAESKDASGIGGATNPYASAQGALEQIKESWEALGKFVIPKSKQEAKDFVDEINKMAISQESLTTSLQRSMGGVIIGAETFAKKFKDAYYNGVEKMVNGVRVMRTPLIEIGASFKDTTESVEGLASGIGRMVNPSDEVIYNMVALAKATGQSSKEVGGMVALMTKYNYTQLDATKKIHDLSVEARSAGLSAKGYLTEINKNMKSLSGFGFKSGVDGMKNMVKQAMLLRTSVESIGAMKMQDSILEPEGAIEMAANFQMLGGAVGKLADPFQLMYMAQNDMEGLQNELVNSTKAAMTFNEKTGGFDIATEDMYRLRQQAKLTNTNLEDLVDTGRQAAKMDYLKDKFDLGGLSEEHQNVLSGLAEIGPGGEVKIDLPGYEEGNQTLQEMLKDGTFTDKLEEYQKNAAKSEEQLAVDQFTISEEQARDVNVIKEAILKNLTSDQRQSLEASIKDLTKTTGAKSKATSEAGATATKNFPEKANKAAKTGVNAIPAIDKPTLDTIEDTQQQVINFLESGITVMSDGLIPANGTAPTILSAGKIFKGIAGDDVMLGTNLIDGVNKMGGNIGGNIGGKLDININVSGAVNGDNGNIAKLFENPRVQKQIMDTVLYKLDSYKKQQGVIA